MLFRTYSFFSVCTLKCKSLKSCDWYKSLVLRCGIDFLYILASSVSFSVKRSACWQRITWLATPKTLAVTPAYNKPSLLYVFLILLLAMFSENRFVYVKSFRMKISHDSATSIPFCHRVFDSSFYVYVHKCQLQSCILVWILVCFYFCIVFFCTQCQFRDNARLVFYF